MLSIDEFAAMLKLAAVRAKAEIDIPTEIVMVGAEKRAKEAIGTYEFGWPQLAESTQADRVAIFQELGTSRGTPPRSYLGESLMRSGPEIETAFGEFMMTILSGRSAR